VDRETFQIRIEVGGRKKEDVSKLAKSIQKLLSRGDDGGKRDLTMNEPRGQIRLEWKKGRGFQKVKPSKCITSRSPKFRKTKNSLGKKESLEKKKSI